MGGAHHCSAPPPVSEMTYTVSSGTLNPSIPYHRDPRSNDLRSLPTLTMTLYWWTSSTAGCWLSLTQFVGWRILLPLFCMACLIFSFHLFFGLPRVLVSVTMVSSAFVGNLELSIRLTNHCNQRLSVFFCANVSVWFNSVVITSFSSFVFCLSRLTF